MIDGVSGSSNGVEDSGGRGTVGAFPEAPSFHDLFARRRIEVYIRRSGRRHVNRKVSDETMCLFSHRGMWQVSTQAQVSSQALWNLFP